MAQQRTHFSWALGEILGVGDRQAVEYERACRLPSDFLGVCGVNRITADAGRAEYKAGVTRAPRAVVNLRRGDVARW